jgi:fructoselysine-6-P-deglycase FrlB-like protein/sugar/nucleoside kinase (ribokinase family)
MTPSVLIVGNLTLDDVVFADGRAHMGTPGGNALYGALGARLWCSQVGIVTRAGEDFPLSQVTDIDLGGVVRIEGPAVRCWVLYEEDGRRQFVDRTPRERYAEVMVRPGDLPAGWLAARPVVHVAAMRLDAAERIVARLREAGARIVLDTHEDHCGDAGRLLALARQVDVFCPSRDELTELAGRDEPVATAPAIAETTGTPVVAKLGADGCLVADGDVVALASCAREVVDVTGAGDAFCGGLAAALADGASLVEAAARASVSAAFVVGAHGSLRFAEAAAAFSSLPDPPSPRRVPRVGASDGDGRDIGAMGAEIDTIPTVIERQLQLLDEPLAVLADQLTADGVEHVVLTGCGDSAFAGMATALAFSRAGIDARAVHALDLSRYEMRYLPAGSAIVCVSYSGQVGRTIEAAIQGREFGHRVIALTGEPENRLAAEADVVLPLTVPTAGLSPGTSTYVAMVTALAHLAAHWGGAGSEPLARAPALARATLDAAAEPARELGRRLAGQRWVTFLGAGPNEASARFGAAKLLEGPQILGVATNIEEWAHEEYFVTGPGTPVILVAPPGAASDRFDDVLNELSHLGAAIAVVGAAKPGALHVPLADGLPEELSPLLAALPLSLAAFTAAALTGKRSYNFRDAEAERRHYDTIHAVRVGTPA